MAEYTSNPTTYNCCSDYRMNKLSINPKRAILTLIFILNMDERDFDKPGLWEKYEENGLDVCPICKERIWGNRVIETFCLHRFHVSCLLHQIVYHNLKFCPEEDCNMKIF